MPCQVDRPFDLLESRIKSGPDSDGNALAFPQMCATDNRAHHNARKKQGIEIIENYYELNKDNWIIPDMMERAFNLKIGAYSFSGRIDRIDKLEDGTYEGLILDDLSFDIFSIFLYFS